MQQRTDSDIWPSSARFICLCFCHFSKVIPLTVCPLFCPVPTAVIEKESNKNVIFKSFKRFRTLLTLLLDPYELGRKQITAPQDVTFAYTDLSQKGALQQVNRIYMVPSISVATSFSHRASRKCAFPFFTPVCLFLAHSVQNSCYIL